MHHAINEYQLRLDVVDFQKIKKRVRQVRHYTVADLGGGVRGVQITPLWQLVMYFCVHNCTSPSNNYAAVACSNINRTQLLTLTDLQTFD